MQKKATLLIKVNFPVTEILSQAFYKQCDIKGFFVNKFIFFILFCIPLHAEVLNIMTYNVWYGFNKKQSLALAQEWLNEQNIDVLALQELKGFNQTSFSSASKAWGHNYSILNPRTSGFPQGLSSNQPIEFIGMIKPEGKGYRETLHCKTHGIHFLVVHLNPHNYLKRLVEAKAVTTKAKELMENGDKVVVLGDFNTHSDIDREFLNKQQFLIDKWQNKEKAKKSFRQFDENGEIDFSVMNTFMNSGLKDHYKKSIKTFPTKILAPQDSDAEYSQKWQRIDFILTSPSLKDFSPVISYPEDENLHKISDHFPVKLSLESPPL